MLSSPILDVAISIVFIYLLLSILVSSLHEIWVMFMNKRGKLLREVILHMLDDKDNKDYGQMLYEHPHMTSLSRKGSKKLPSYIPSEKFAIAVMDLIAGDKNPDQPLSPTEEKAKEVFERFKLKVASMKEGSLKRILSSMLDHVDNRDQLRAALEKWFNDHMDRVSGWYKRNVRKTLFATSLVLAIVLNVDSIFLVKSIWRDNQLRDRIVNASIDYSNAYTTYKGSASLDSTLRAIDSTYYTLGMLKLPIGWNWSGVESAFGGKQEADGSPLPSNANRYKQMHSSWGWLLWIPGWIITAFALTFGAPFWFDLLNKLINMRMSGKKPS